MCERRHRIRNWKRLRTIVVLAVMIMAVLIPSFVSFSQSDPSAIARGRLADRLTSILNKLDQELSQLPSDKFPKLEGQLDAISSLLDDLISTLDTPPSVKGEGPTLKEQAFKLDLMFHRLVIILERIARADAPKPLPAQTKARETIAELRVWINGYLAGVTSEMSPREARRYEEMARALLTDVGEHLARIAAQARSKDEAPSRLDTIIAHMKAQLRLLDRFLMRTFGPPPRVLAPHRP